MSTSPCSLVCSSQWNLGFANRVIGCGIHEVVNTRVESTSVGSTERGTNKRRLDVSCIFGIVIRSVIHHVNPACSHMHLGSHASWDLMFDLRLYNY